MSWKDKIRNPSCTLCPLHEGADFVCLMGAGSRKAKLMIVGEAPGAREDDSGQAFVGPAGALLTEELRRVGLHRDDFYITNVAKCRPPSNRTPERNEAKICAATYLSREIQIVAPDWILLLGNTALQGVAGKSGITKHRGTVLESGHTRILPTFHPAAALRNPKYLPQLRADLERFARMVAGKSSSGVADTKTKLVRTPSQLAALCRELDRQEVVAFDIETTGLDEWAEDAKVVTMGFCWEPGRAYVVPVDHSSKLWQNQGIQPMWVLQKMKKHLERPGLKWVAHNGKFDMRYMAAHGIFMRQSFDTMLAGHLLDENRPKSLEAMAQLLLGSDPWKDQEARTNAYDTNLKRLAVYNARDCDKTLQLYHVLKQQLVEQPRLGRIFVKLMMPASNVLTKVERIGLPLDVPRVHTELATTEDRYNRVFARLLKRVPKHKRATFNPRSHPQVAQWLFVDLGLPITERTGKGAPSSKESVLVRLAREHAEPKLLLELRAHEKRLQFLRSWLERVDAGGRIHTQYKLFGTVTGRLSSESPNLQQVPREKAMRSCFSAPPGWVFVESDFSQVELRIAAMVAPDRTLLRIFHERRDPHLETASEMTRKPAAWVQESDRNGTEYRKRAKGVNFGYLYGMGEEKFVEYAETNYDWVPTPAEAHDSREAFFKKYTGLRPWHDRQRRLASRYGSVNSPIGRVRHLPDVYSSDKAVSAEAERQAINSPVQSFASDLMLVSMVLLDDRLPARTAYVVGTVHDALLFLVRENAVDDVAPLIKRTMEQDAVKAVKKWFGFEVTVPIEAEVKVGSAWGLGSIWE
jgi:uracil-DNA glycosylase family 4